MTPRWGELSLPSAPPPRTLGLTCSPALNCSHLRDFIVQRDEEFTVHSWGCYSIVNVSYNRSIYGITCVSYRFLILALALAVTATITCNMNWCCTWSAWSGSGSVSRSGSGSRSGCWGGSGMVPIALAAPAETFWNCLWTFQQDMRSVGPG